jgi:SAM-dependent methyltransferase
MTANLKQGGPPNSSADAGFQFWRAFARYWRESVRYFGWWRSLRELASATWDALLELLPSRRKAAFGDLDYDWEHSVDTTRSNVGFATQFLTGVMARPYFATEPWLFEQIMEALAPSIQQSAVSVQSSASSEENRVYARLNDFTFIDLGSGKGRALLMAAPYGFKRIIGVELIPEWHRTAQENIRKFAVANASALSMESICMDARDLRFPDEPLVIYLFNPFPEPVFAAVMNNLRRSIVQTPRAVYILYRFPEFENLLLQAVWLEKVAGAEQWAVYKNRREAGFF